MQGSVCVDTLNWCNRRTRLNGVDLTKWIRLVNAVLLFHIANKVAVTQNRQMFPGVYFLKGIVVTRRMNHLKRFVARRQKLTEKVSLIIHLPSPELTG